MTFKIQKGVDPPEGKRRARNYGLILSAISDMIPGDPCCVKIIFETKKEMIGARQAIYRVNTILSGKEKWKYTVTSEPEALTLYVSKIPVVMIERE